MKDFLLLIVAGLVLVAIFGDGGAVLSPTISPAFDAALNVQYSPDRSVTTIEQQTNIDTNIEHQMVVVQPPQSTNNGVSLVDVGPGRCAVQPGDVVEQEQGNGACFVWNGNRKYFINPNGNRWEVDAATSIPGNSLGQAPPNTVPAQSSTTIVTTTVLLAPDVPRTLPEMQAAFLRNGGQLPTLWSWRGEDYKVRWLSQQEETWR